MSPVPGICWLFQAGQCPFSDTHRGEDGSPQFHVCQPCFQVRHELIEHTCWSSHPGECSKKPYGAIACPLGMNSSPQSQVQPTFQPTVTFPSLSSRSVSPPVTSQLDFGFLNHKPTFKCDCQWKLFRGSWCRTYLLQYRLQHWKTLDWSTLSFLSKWRCRTFLLPLVWQRSCVSEFWSVSQVWRGRLWKSMGWKIWKL